MIRSAIHWHKVICRQPGDFIGFPTVTQTADGEILAIFSGDRETHHCPYGKSQLIRSSDGGETWSAAETVNNTPLDDRDAGIVALTSGTLVMSWFVTDTREVLENYRGPVPNKAWGLWPTPKEWESWRRHCDKIPDDVRKQWVGTKIHEPYTRRSTDGGRTWEEPVRSIVMTPHGPIQLSDGSLRFVGIITDEGGEGARTLACAASTDEARSWSLIGTMSVDKRFGETHTFSEPHAVEVDDGRLVCMWRHTPSDKDASQHFLHQCESDDGGKTWSVIRPTPIWGYPAHLLRLHCGDVLASYGYRREPMGQRACLSHDGCATWDVDNEIVLRDDATSVDLGYPSTVELEPGEMLTVYYQLVPPDEKPTLVATRWSLA